MQHTEAYYKALLSGFIAHSITPDQVEELFVFIGQEPEMYQRLMSDPELMALIGESAGHSPDGLRPVADDRIRTHLLAYADGSMGKTMNAVGDVKVVSMTRLRRRWGWAAAAVILIVGGITAAVISGRRQSRVVVREIASQPVKSDVKAPQSNRAMITLTNGRQVSLDSLNKGVLAQQGNMKLVKLADGQIAYQAAPGETYHELQYNTLSNPRGSKVVDMALSDGSHVWLNAGSSITFPVAFTGKDRKVSMTGEAYFEIAGDASKPFSVSKGDVEVKVLGTHFNVNAYEDESDIRVTLLQGAVKVVNSLSGIMLSHGQQATVAMTGTAPQPVKIVPNPNIDAVMAWKDGLFNFNKISLQDVMRQLARWYDIEVEYKGAVSTKMLGGEMQRGLSLSEVLEGLHDIGVHFRIEGKKLTVMP